MGGNRPFGVCFVDATEFVGIEGSNTPSIGVIRNVELINKNFQTTNCSCHPTSPDKRHSPTKKVTTVIVSVIGKKQHQEVGKIHEN